MNYNEIVYATSNVMKIAGQIQTYSWDDKFCKEDLVRNLEKMQEALKDVDWTSFSKEELFNLGFGNWDGEIILIPIHFYNSIINGTILYSISGSEHMKGTSEIDNDVRFGCMAYGFRIKELKGLPKAIETTEIPNEVKADKGILTEEELKKIEIFKNHRNSVSWEVVDEIIASHRMLQDENFDLKASVILNVRENKRLREELK